MRQDTLFQRKPSVRPEAVSFSEKHPRTGNWQNNERGLFGFMAALDSGPIQKLTPFLPVNKMSPATFLR